MLANPRHGLVSQLGRAHQVSRQTLYRWAATGRQALEEALGYHFWPPKQNEAISLVVLTLLIETHASYRGIQTCLRELHGVHLSLGRMVGIVKEAGQRAQTWLSPRYAQRDKTKQASNKETEEDLSSVKKEKGSEKDKLHRRKWIEERGASRVYPERTNKQCFTQQSREQSQRTGQR